MVTLLVTVEVLETVFSQFDCEVDIGIPNPTGHPEILQIHTKNMRLRRVILSPSLAPQST